MKPKDAHVVTIAFVIILSVGAMVNAMVYGNDPMASGILLGCIIGLVVSAVMHL